MAVRGLVAEPSWIAHRAVVLAAARLVAVRGLIAEPYWIAHRTVILEAALLMTVRGLVADTSPGPLSVSRFVSLDSRILLRE